MFGVIFLPFWLVLADKETCGSDDMVLDKLVFRGRLLMSRLAKDRLRFLTILFFRTLREPA
jgi:hypothetical protein